jgi:hypothetical protein
MVGNWSFSVQEACAINQPSGIFIPRIKSIDDFVTCPNDGADVVKAVLE